MKEVTLMRIFRSTFVLSAFTIGGGYTIVPLMENKMVNELGWIDSQEMMDMVAVGQSSPGAIAVNVSVLLGYKLMGIKGSLVALCGAVLPPLVIMLLVVIAFDEFKSNQFIQTLMTGMQVSVWFVIFSSVYKMAKDSFKINGVKALVYSLISMIASLYLKVNLILIIMIAILIGIIVTIKGGKANVHSD